MYNFNEDLPEDVVNQLIENAGWDRFGMEKPLLEAKEEDDSGDEKEDKGKDKAKKMPKKPGKEMEKDSEMCESTASCPLCSSELEEALDRETIDNFNEALQETYEIEYHETLNSILEAISELDDEELDEYLSSLDESVLEDLEILVESEDEEVEEEN